MNFKLYNKIIIIYNWPSLFGQDDWILAKFLFCVLWPQKRTELICRHLDWTSLVNYKGFIMRSKRELSFSCATNAGKPRAGKILSSWPLVKPLRPSLCEEELGPSPSRPWTFASVYMRKTLTLLPFALANSSYACSDDCLALTLLSWPGWESQGVYREKSWSGSLGWPIGFSGSGISVIRSSGFGIWKKIRNWKYAREVEYQK